MRIISKFKDYYDSALGFGIDESIMFIRGEKKHNVDSMIPNNTFTVFLENQSTIIYFSIILFCGKSYPVLYYIESECSSMNKKMICFYSIDTYLDFLKKHKGNNKAISRNTSKVDRFWLKSESDLMKINIDKVENIHFKYKSPIIMINRSDKGRAFSELVINPKLKYYSFFKVFPPYQAFQEIDMYISGVIGSNESKMINISDKEMHKKKGFHDYSFKTRPK